MSVDNTGSVAVARFTLRTERRHRITRTGGRLIDDCQRYIRSMRLFDQAIAPAAVDAVHAKTRDAIFARGIVPKKRDHAARNRRATRNLAAKVRVLVAFVRSRGYREFTWRRSRLNSNDRMTAPRWFTMILGTDR